MPYPLPERFQAFAEGKNLLPKNARVLATVSGGVDSVVLANLLKTGGWLAGIAHCNFQLRGAESDGDEAFVRELAERLAVPFFSQKFDTQQVATARGISIQLAARELRYPWFEKIRAENGFDLVATGHNLDDSVETTLFNLVRGTGLAGLTGIPAKNGHVVRPLLFAERADIQAFALENHLAWREDSSNASDKYSRNFIRHHLLPVLAEMNPNFRESIARMQQHVREAADNLEWLSQIFFEEMSDRRGDAQFIDKQAFESAPEPAPLLFDHLRPHDFSEEQVRQMVENLDGQPGKEWVAGNGTRVLLDRKNLIVAPPEKPLEWVEIQEDDLLVRLPDGTQFAQMHLPSAPGKPLDSDTIFVDAETLHHPLHLRHWAAGDRFQPLGLGGQSQKLQNFFVNRKLSGLEKERAWVLADGSGQIIWVLGLRADERFKVSPSSHKFLKFSWLR